MRIVFSRLFFFPPVRYYFHSGVIGACPVTAETSVAISLCENYNSNNNDNDNSNRHPQTHSPPHPHVAPSSRRRQGRRRGSRGGFGESSPRTSGVIASNHPQPRRSFFLLGSVQLSSGIPQPSSRCPSRRGNDGLDWRAWSGHPSPFTPLPSYRCCCRCSP